MSSIGCSLFFCQNDIFPSYGQHLHAVGKSKKIIDNVVKNRFNPMRYESRRKDD